MFQELKPCPFCGGEAELNHEFMPIEKSYVRCRKCDINGQAFGKAFGYASDDKAIEAWNRRVEDDK